MDRRLYRVLSVFEDAENKQRSGVSLQWFVGLSRLVWYGVRIDFDPHHPMGGHVDPNQLKFGMFRTCRDVYCLKLVGPKTLRIIAP